MSDAFSLPFDGGPELARASQEALQRWWDSLTLEEQERQREWSKRACEEHRRRFINGRLGIAQGVKE